MGDGEARHYKANETRASADDDDPSERLLSQLSGEEAAGGNDLSSAMAHDLILLLYTLSDFGELEWPLI